jgi:hypothetical protein
MVFDWTDAVWRYINSTLDSPAINLSSALKLSGSRLMKAFEAE